MLRSRPVDLNAPNCAPQKGTGKMVCSLPLTIWKWQGYMSTSNWALREPDTPQTSQDACLWAQWTQSRRTPVPGDGVTRWLKIKILRNWLPVILKVQWLVASGNIFETLLPCCFEWSSLWCLPVPLIYSEMKPRWLIWQQGMLLFLIKANKKTISLLKRCILKAFQRWQMCAP